MRMLPGIDSHCHLEYMRSPQAVVDEARLHMAGIVTSVADPADADAILDLCHNNKDFLFAALGIHPTRVVQVSDKAIENYESFMRSHADAFVAVGEVGLDYHHVQDEQGREASRVVFERLIEFANELKKPLVIHTRNAMTDTLQLLERARVPVMMHFFSGTHEELRTCLECGYFISFTTITCVSKKFRKLAKKTPLEQMLLETDAPWLDPEVIGKTQKEQQGSAQEPGGSEHQESSEQVKVAADDSRNAFTLTNRPWKILLTAQRLEKELGVSRQEILERTEQNARRLFSL